MAGAAVRDWSKLRGVVRGTARSRLLPGPDRSPGVNTYIPRSLQDKGWSGNDEQRAGRVLIAYQKIMIPRGLRSVSFNVREHKGGE